MLSFIMCLYVLNERVKWKKLDYDRRGKEGEGDNVRIETSLITAHFVDLTL